MTPEERRALIDTLGFDPDAGGYGKPSSPSPTPKTSPSPQVGGPGGFQGGTYIGAIRTHDMYGNPLDTSGIILPDGTKYSDYIKQFSPAPPSAPPPTPSPPPASPSLTPTTGGNKGYAYVDKYGFTHVSSDPETARRYAAPGTQGYEYAGNYGGGYALGPGGGRVTLPLPGARDFGNLDAGSGDLGLAYSGDYGKHIGSPLPLYPGAATNQTPSLVPTANSTYPKLSDFLSGYGRSPSWDSNTGLVSIGNQSYRVGSVPGTYFDPTTSYHYVNNPNALLGALNMPLIPTTTNSPSTLPPLYPGQNNYVSPSPRFDQARPYEYTDWQPNPNIRLSSGPETIIPTTAGLQQHYGLQNELYNRYSEFQKRESERKQLEQRIKEQEAIALKEQNKLENQPWYQEMYKNKTQAEIDKLRRDANAPYRTETEPRPTQTDRRNEATAAGIEWIKELQRQGKGMETINKLIDEHYATFVRDGADVQAMKDYAYRLFSGLDEKNYKRKMAGQSYEGDQEYMGTLGFGD